jgi:hypothetical protein
MDPARRAMRTGNIRGGMMRARRSCEMVKMTEASECIEQTHLWMVKVFLFADVPEVAVLAKFQANDETGSTVTMISSQHVRGSGTHRAG